jgi:cytochrome oxidase Cu insertion factor (SCO1/SenC/PrrC family)
MVTVDPDRDNELLPGYVESFVADAEAAGTTDADRLAAAAEPFGVSYDVTTATRATSRCPTAGSSTSSTTRVGSW